MELIKTPVSEELSSELENRDVFIPLNLIQTEEGQKHLVKAWELYKNGHGGGTIGFEEQQDGNEFAAERLKRTASGILEDSIKLQKQSIKKRFRSAMIVTKAQDHELVYSTAKLSSWLLRTLRHGSDVGVDVYVDKKLQTSKRFNATKIVAPNARFENMLKH